MKSRLIIDFNTDKFEDQKEIQAIVTQKHLTWQCAMLEFDNWMRSIIKHSIAETDVEQIRIDSIAEVREKFYEFLKEEDLEIC